MELEIKYRTLNLDWIGDNYNNIIQWANNICKGDALAEELAHYAIEKFLTHPKRDEILDRDRLDPDYGHNRAFLLGIMRNSWFGAKSEFTRIHKAHRADIGKRKRVVSDAKFTQLLDGPVDEYDHDRDRLIEAIEGILEEMELDLEGKLWFDAKLFTMWLATPNFSELSRRTDIPRTSISNAVEEAKRYILKELQERGII